MTIKSNGVPFSSFSYVTIAGHLIFAIPAIGGIFWLSLIGVRALFFIIAPITLLSIPITAAISWFIAKGSNWMNTSAAITAACSLPGRFYGVLFGGLLGFHLFSKIGILGGVILIILFYILALAITIPLSKFLSSRIISKTTSEG